MKKISLKFIFPIVMLVLLILVLSRPMGNIPALGELLNPFSGIIQNEQDELVNRKLGFVDRDFTISYDDNRVPHIFAETENDMHFAQGYVTAKDRLWQMDFMTYASAGRLSEIFGKNYLTYDRIQRRHAMLESAKSTLAFIENNALTKKAMDNYTAGVNAYIDELTKKSLPFEYKLMGYQPEKWTNLKSVLIMKYVGSLLTGYEDDVGSSHMLLALGQEDFFKLYPDYRLVNDSNSLILEEVMTDLPYKDQVDYSFLYSRPKATKSRFDPRLGSNAWAVGGTKTKSGRPLLCNDPHLNLTFPSIWYEIQLKSSERNVYGYAIPGAPGVIIGFNEQLAWGVTNGSADVLDWYKLDIKDDYSAYKYEGKWKKTRSVLEEIKVKNGKTFTDTVYYTVHGPIVITDQCNENPEILDHALNWALHSSTNEFLAILMMNKASKRSDFEKAIQLFEFPGQNFIYADLTGDIAYYHQGKLRKTNVQGDGKFIRNGTSSRDFLDAYLDVAELPKSINPDRDYVISANNNPWDTTAQYYVNGYFDELRSDKLSQILKNKKKLSVSDMKLMQLDNTNHLAELAIPILLKSMNGNGKDKLIEKLKKWDYKCELNSDEPLFFEIWWDYLAYYTWDEVHQFEKASRLPDALILLDLIENEPNSKFFQSSTGPNGLKAILDESFNQAKSDWESTKSAMWKDTHQVTIKHLSSIESLGMKHVAIAGHEHALNAMSENWGPSLRMIVDLSGGKPTGYGVTAGGPSGNPASNYYSSNVSKWLKGKYTKMKFYSSLNEAKVNQDILWISH